MRSYGKFKICILFFSALSLLVSAQESMPEDFREDYGQRTDEQTADVLPEQLVCGNGFGSDFFRPDCFEVFAGSSCLFDIGNEHVPVYAELGVILQKGNFFSKAGVSVSKGACAFTIKSVYDFIDARGKGNLYINDSVFSLFLMGHTAGRKNISSQGSVYAGIIYKYYLDDFFSFAAECSVGYVSSAIMGTEIKPVSNFDSTIAFVFDFRLPGSNEISISAGSYEFFRHPLLGCPSFSFTYSHEFRNNLGLDMSLLVRYLDFFTLSSYLDSCGINLTVRYTF